MPRIKANPEFAIIDNEIDILVHDLQPDSPVTISASTVYFNILYIGYGHYFSDSHGCVNLKKQISHGGTYYGLQSMGLFNSMRAMPSKHAYPRLLVKGSSETILNYELKVWKGHLTQDQVHQLHFRYILPGAFNSSKEYFMNYNLCQCNVQRTYLSPKVRRIPIKVNIDGDTVCGVFFLPEGNGPFPGVIDLFGGAGGCVEIRAALLAKHGFASLALAYFRHEGLKAKTFADFEMSYFDRAIEWLMKQPQVKPGGVSMVGVCLGAQIALISAIRNPNVRCTICINSNMIMILDSKSENPLVDYVLRTTAKGRQLSQIWGGMVSANYDNPSQFPRPPLQYAHDNHILFIVGEHDRYPRCVDDAIDQLERSGKKRIVKKLIKGQGHLIEPPYMPLCVASPNPHGISSDDPYAPLIDFLAYDWNGDFKNHGNSQIEAWKVLLDFLHKHGGGVEISKL